MLLDMSKQDSKGKRYSTVVIGEDTVRVELNVKYNKEEKRSATFLIEAHNRVKPSFRGTGATWLFVIKSKNKHEGKYTSLEGVHFTVDIRHVQDWNFDIECASEAPVDLSSTEL